MLVLWLAVAHADQCAWNSEAHARAAARRLPIGSEMVALCEPCGEKVPTRTVVEKVDVKPVGGTFWEVSVNGVGIDLAYVFIHAKAADPFVTNLSKLVGCSSQDVSRTLPLAKPEARPLDLPVPSPCAQRWTDTNGRETSVSHYVYGADRFLEQVITDDGADGVPDAVVTFTHDAAGKPLVARLDSDADGDVDSTSDCATTYCTTNWIPECPANADCTRNNLGLVERMTFAETRGTNDYRCWIRPDGIWRYQRPADVPPTVVH